MISTKLSVEIFTPDKALDKELEAMVLAAGGLRIAAADSGERPELLIFELSDNFHEEFRQLQSLLNSNSVGEVFVTSKIKDADLLLKAIKTGIKEFLSQPLSKAEVGEALASFKKRMGQSERSVPGPQGQVIHVMGAKGGVGTTTIAANLAMMLARKKGAVSVALMDMNSVFGEVPLFLSLKPAYHWGEIVKNIKRLDTTFLMNVLSQHVSGVRILPSPSYLNGHPPATAEIMEKLLSLMKKTFDYVIIDGGQALDPPSLKVIEMSDQVFLITLLSLPCLNNTNKLTKSLNNLEVTARDRVKIIINRFLKKSDISIQEAEESIGKNIFWQIPNDYKTTMSAINKGKTLYDISPKASITRSLMDLSDSLLEGREGGGKKEKRARRFFGK